MVDRVARHDAGRPRARPRRAQGARVDRMNMAGSLGKTGRTSGARGRCCRWRSSKSPGRPGRATMRGEPLGGGARRPSAAAAALRPAVAVRHEACRAPVPRRTSSSITSREPRRRAGSPRSMARLSATSSALPAVRPRHWPMSVSSAVVGRPAPCRHADDAARPASRASLGVGRRRRSRTSRP